MYIVAPMTTFLALLLMPLLAGTSSAPLKPVIWKVVDGDYRTVASGKTVRVILEADIAKGWHIYSLTQKPGGPIPLTIQLLDAADVRVRGLIRGPKPVRKFDRNFGIETELYRGKAKFTIPLGVPARSVSGKRELQLAARYQVCSETLCLPPRTEKFPVTLRIRRAG